MFAWVLVYQISLTNTITVDGLKDQQTCEAVAEKFDSQYDAWYKTNRFHFCSSYLAFIPPQSLQEPQ